MNINIFKDLGKNIGGAFENREIEQFQKELSNKLNNMEEKYTIDRYENDIAICENRDTGEIIKIEKSELPLNSKEGTIIKKIGEKYFEDMEETKMISERIKDKMNNLWN